jgi:hypothetical protein
MSEANRRTSKKVWSLELINLAFRFDGLDLCKKSSRIKGLQNLVEKFELEKSRTRRHQKMPESSKNPTILRGDINFLQLLTIDHEQNSLIRV